MALRHELDGGRRNITKNINSDVIYPKRNRNPSCGKTCAATGILFASSIY